MMKVVVGCRTVAVRTTIGMQFTQRGFVPVVMALYFGQDLSSKRRDESLENMFMKKPIKTSTSPKTAHLGKTQHRIKSD